jgi:hypothetical protein
MGLKTDEFDGELACEDGGAVGGLVKGFCEEDFGECSSAEGLEFCVTYWETDPLIVCCSPVFQLLPWSVYVSVREGVQKVRHRQRKCDFVRHGLPPSSSLPGSPSAHRPENSQSVAGVQSHYSGQTHSWLSFRSVQMQFPRRRTCAVGRRVRGRGCRGTDLRGKSMCRGRAGTGAGLGRLRGGAGSSRWG